MPSPTRARNHQERNALRLLCSNLIQPVTRQELCGLLGAEMFLSPLHVVVFEEIAAMGTAPARTLRQMLPARVTNRGFPDFAMKEFLGRDQATEQEIEELFASVLGLIEERHGTTGNGREN